MPNTLSGASRGAKIARAAKPAVLLFLSAFLALSCATRLAPIPEGMTSAEIIQKAQERSDVYDWKGARYYYSALLEKFPYEPNLVVTAMYELAYIEYKQDHYDAARAGFNAVIEKYSTPEGASLPQTWKILAEKVLAKLPAPKAPKTAGAAAPNAAAPDTATTSTSLAPASPD